MKTPMSMDVLPTHLRWCWIGDRDSSYLDGLVRFLAQTRPNLGEQCVINLQLVYVGSTARLHRVLSKTRADVIVWLIPANGILELIDHIGSSRRLHFHCRHIVAGIASPAEQLTLMEAGCCWIVNQPHAWSHVPAALFRRDSFDRQSS